MRTLLMLFVLAIFSTLDTYGQNFIFIGEYSYPSTERFTLKKNYEEGISAVEDLYITFAKDNSNILIAVSSKLPKHVAIIGKLVIYLDDGTVISCIDRDVKDHVDDTATSIYQLTNEELLKLKNSNINTIRYQVKCSRCGSFNSYDGTYSASNKGNSGIDFIQVISEFYE